MGLKARAFVLIPQGPRESDPAMWGATGGKNSGGLGRKGGTVGPLPLRWLTAAAQENECA